MGIGNIGWSGMVMILIVVLIVFGPSKLPELGKAVGNTLKEFKKSTREIMNDPPVAETEKLTSIVEMSPSTPRGVEEDKQSSVTP